MMPDRTRRENHHDDVPAPPSILTAPRPQGANRARSGAIAAPRVAAGPISTPTSRHAATPTSLPVRAGLAVLIALAVLAAIAAIALLAATSADGGPWTIVNSIFQQTWPRAVAAAIPILLLPLLSLSPLIAVVVIAALVELTRPRYGSHAHTDSPEPTTGGGRE